MLGITNVSNAPSIVLKDTVAGDTLKPWASGSYNGYSYRCAIPITGVRPIDEAIVTRGGVSVKEINPKTMESKLLPGLYFAGEIIDVDGYTGGFNLQIAFSTGRLAGRNAGESALNDQEREE